MNSGDWVYSITYQSISKVIETQTFWGETFCRVWLPLQNSVVRLRADQLLPIEQSPPQSADYVSYIATAARIADALTHDVLLAPLESSVIPLPHQLRALSRIIASDRIRFLLADEVGLGKTIEAGLIMKELKLRGLVRRTLIIAPRGIVTQWIAEMETHFQENFSLISPGDIQGYSRLAGDGNLWQNVHQALCPMDSVKPIDSRKGWTPHQIAAYNRERFDDLVSAGWDLIIVDEAHRLGGSNSQVARYRLGQGLSEAAPYLLLLSATPHQGKTDAFQRLMSLLDSEAFPDITSVTKERVQPYVVRTEKRRAITAEGNPLFKPRHTELLSIPWGEGHTKQKLLYEAVTDYVRLGYNQAMKEKRSYIGFLMILMQRLVASSTRAVRMTLERRLEALEQSEGQMSLPLKYTEEEWSELDGQEQLDMLLEIHLNALKNEHAEVSHLLEAARDCDERGPDVKAESLLELLYRLQQEEGEHDLKALIFTEFVPTQEMLMQFLQDRGFSVVCLNGSMNMEERRRAQDAFAGPARILVSTDAGGEGLNLQFCHVVINFDIPWNPMKLEQRIGRVDRIGQGHVVRALNFVLQDSVEHRVREVLEEKLEIIFNELGIDKASDVLDSAQAGQLFEELFVEAIVDPDAIESTIESTLQQFRKEARETKLSSSLLGGSEPPDPAEVQKILSHPLPLWVEHMTVCYLKARNGKAIRKGKIWNLIWPDGLVIEHGVFTSKEAKEISGAHLLTLEDSRIRGLTAHISPYIDGQPVPVIFLKNLSNQVKGLWALYQVTLHTEEWNRKRITPLFLNDDGRLLAPTARRVWDELLSMQPVISGNSESSYIHTAYGMLIESAHIHCKAIYNELLQEHTAILEKEKEKIEYSFSIRRKSIERIGLPQVKAHRLNQLDHEVEEWRTKFSKRIHVQPELIPLLVLRVEGSKSSD